VTLLETLATMPDLLEATLQDFPPPLWNWAPPDWAAAPAEQFSALATVCHLRDIERDGYHLRLNRVAREEQPDLASIDGFALQRERNYAGDSLPLALAAFREARAETVRLVRGWGPEVKQRQATFAEYGTLTASGLLHLLASHDLQHLSGLRWLLARASAWPRR
jgi:DinB superfamily